MGKIELVNEKALKLNNPVMIDVQKCDFEKLNLIVEKMENYIKAKGYIPVGPLIQYSSSKINENGELDITVKLIRQSSQFINHVEEPYKCESVLRVKNCMYVRYTGPESMLKFAYDKINLTAFEEDIKLKGDSYTIFVNQIDDNIVADIFMERAEDE
jgi:hypothetical protein